MPDVITITGVSSLVDGTYETDVLERPMKPIEWGWVKRLSGYLPNNWTEGLIGGDAELICAFAVVALVRVGKIDKKLAVQVGEMLKDPDSDDATIKFEIVDAEDDAVPPAEDSPTGSTPTESTPTSGNGSSEHSESQEKTPATTGNGGSAPSITSGPVTLTT